MSSDTFKRAFKLLASTFQMIVERKRHLESVIAALQKIAFEDSGYPKKKNWPAICDLGRTDAMFMMAVATLDMDKLDDTGHGIIAAFPACFCKEELHGPYPLSMIRQSAAQNAAADGGGDPDLLTLHGDIPKDVPIISFDKFGNHIVSGGSSDDLLPLPDEIDPDAELGSIITYQSHRFVVIENSKECEELHLAPEECIAVDV